MTCPEDPLRNPSEAFGNLNAQKYEAELDLVDRYQSFVAELLRLSLAGIGVFGFLYRHIFSGLDANQLTAEVATKIYLAKWIGAAGVLALGFCAAFALIFRFYATEGVRYYIEALRFVPDEKDLPSDQLVRATQSLDRRYRKILVCRWSKGLASIFLGLGSVLIAIAFSLLVVTA